MATSHKKIATEMASRFVRKTIFEMDETEIREERMYAKYHGMTCVKEIIKAIHVTMSHCTLNKTDAAEVKKDLKFWEDIYDWINSLPEEGSLK
jgi:DNA phosphorothioation-dependent restriction protein DptG